MPRTTPTCSYTFQTLEVVAQALAVLGRGNPTPLHRIRRV